MNSFTKFFKNHPPILIHNRLSLLNFGIFQRRPPAAFLVVNVFSARSELPAPFSNILDIHTILSEYLLQFAMTVKRSKPFCIEKLYHSALPAPGGSCRYSVHSQRLLSQDLLLQRTRTGVSLWWGNYRTQRCCRNNNSSSSAKVTSLETFFSETPCTVRAT